MRHSAVTDGAYLPHADALVRLSRGFDMRTAITALEVAIGAALLIGVVAYCMDGAASLLRLIL